MRKANRKGHLGKSSLSDLSGGGGDRTQTDDLAAAKYALKIGKNVFRCPDGKRQYHPCYLMLVVLQPGADGRTDYILDARAKGGKPLSRPPERTREDYPPAGKLFLIPRKTWGQALVFPCSFFAFG